MKAHSETHFENENICKLLHCVCLNTGDLHLGNDSRILMKDWGWHYCTEVSRLTKRAKPAKNGTEERILTLRCQQKST